MISNACTHRRLTLMRRYVERLLRIDGERFRCFRNFTKVEFSLFWILVCFRGKLKTMNILQYKLLEPFYIRI